MRERGYLNLLLAGFFIFAIKPFKDLANGLNQAQPFNQFLAGNIDLILIVFAVLFLANGLRHFSRGF